MLQVSPQSSWPIAGDIADLLAIVTAQSQTIEDQFALIHAYQDNLDAAQTPPDATATATSTGTTALTLGSVTGVVLNGSTITGTGVPPSLTIVGQQSGTPGGAGVYTTSATTTLGSIPVTISPGGGPSGWPVVQDAPTLNLLMQQQTALLRTQTALIAHYQDVMTTSQTAAPSTGP